MIVYLARDIPAFVMYYVYGESLLIESIDSMIVMDIRIIIYIADMRTKEVSKCTVTVERSIFS